MNTDFDIFIIGGGINGCGIARDAAGRGYTVCLAEMNDLASGTSSWSSKLIHGGLRYLEHYKFRLVREALSEREVLLKSAPHIIWPMRFVLPHHQGLRPAWLLRLGLFLYDHIGRRVLLPATKTLNLKKSIVGQPLKPTFSKGFEYSDCWVDDARLVILNAQDAAEKGAVIETRTKCISARQNKGHWNITTKNMQTGKETTRTAKLIVNAAGPWVDKVLGKTLASNKAKNIRLVQGSHIVVPKLYDHDRAYIFQNADNRIIFALPYEQDYTLIGCTDLDYQGDPKDAAITPKEIDYLCKAASEYFKTPIRSGHIVWSFSGVRSLYDDGATEAQEATRDYVLSEYGGAEPDSARVINIFGGKITTYRKLAEAMMVKIERILGARKQAWTEAAHLSGGDFKTEDFDKIVIEVQLKYPFIEAALAWRLVRSYGTKVWDLLGDAKKSSDLGTVFGATLTECEVKYLMQNEWAMTAQDIVWRRSKLGIKMDKSQIAQLDKWMQKMQGHLDTPFQAVG